MRSDRRSFLLSAAGLLGAMALDPRRALAWETRRAVSLAVIVAKGSPLRTITLAELRSLFGGGGFRGPDGKAVIPVNLKAGSVERVRFDQVVLGLSPDEVSRYWVDHKVRGDARPPHELDSTAALLRAIGAGGGYLGYVPVSAVTSQVRVVLIDGKAPGQAGYLLA